MVSVIPAPSHMVGIARLLPQFADGLSYCLNAALEGTDPRSVDYDNRTDQLIFYHHLSPLDQDLLPSWRDVDEVWIVFKPGADATTSGGVTL